MATYDMYAATALTGASSLAAIDGDNLSDGDGALTFVPASFRSYLYILDADADESTSSPFYIQPSSNPGTKTWVLAYLYTQGLGLIEKSSDPPEPAEGEIIIWVSDGNGDHAGDDGDVMIAGQFGGTTKYGTLWDHSAGDAW